MIAVAVHKRRVNRGRSRSREALLDADPSKLEPQMNKSQNFPHVICLPVHLRAEQLIISPREESHLKI